MEFQLTDEQRSLQETARRYAQTRLPEIARHCEETNHAPDKELVKEYAEMGFLGINVPEQYGGLGLGNLEALLVLEEFGKIPAVGFPVFESRRPRRAIERFGSESLKQRIVPAVCRGEIQVAVSMSEPHAGSALTDLTTRGEVRGHKVILNGTKRWCSGGGHADGYVVYCRLSEDEGARGIGAVYVERDTKGLTFGRPESLMGFRGIPPPTSTSTTTVSADNVVVPAEVQKLMEAFDPNAAQRDDGARSRSFGRLDDVIALCRTAFGASRRVPGGANPARRDEDARRGGAAVDPLRRKQRAERSGPILDSSPPRFGTRSPAKCAATPCN
jgi:butyryl-CoA dehydrogenase